MADPTLITSPVKIDVIPEVVRIVSPLARSAANDTVIPVPTIGLWIMLSIAINALVFWFLLTKLWEVPIPTEARSNTTGLTFNAFSAVAASLTKLPLTLTIKTESGR